MGSKLRQKTTPLARAPGTSLVPFNTAHKLLNLIFLLCYQSVLSPSYLREKICTPELHLKIKRHGQKTTDAQLADPDFDQSSYFWKRLGYNADEYDRMAKFGVFEGYGGPAQLRRYSSAACHIDVVLPHSGCCRVDDLLGICLAAVQLRRLPASEGPTRARSCGALDGPRGAAAGQPGMRGLPVRVASCFE